MGCNGMDIMVAVFVVVSDIVWVLRCNVHMLRVSTLHYSAGSQVLEGFQTVASARVLRQHTIVGLSISIVSIHKFGT